MITKHTVNNTLLPYYPSYTEIHIVTLKPAEGKLRSLTQNLSSHKFLFLVILEDISDKMETAVTHFILLAVISGELLSLDTEHTKCLSQPKTFYTYCLNFLILYLNLVFILLMMKCSQC